MIKNEFQRIWRQRELEIGRIITIQEVARETKLHWETVSNLKEGQTTRFDAAVIAKLCQYFGVASGQPVPFLIYAETD